MSSSTRHRLLCAVSGLLLLPAIIGACFCAAGLYFVSGDLVKHRSSDFFHHLDWSHLVLVWAASGIIGASGYAVAWWRFARGRVRTSTWVSASLLVGILAAIPLLWVVVKPKGLDLASALFSLWSFLCILQAGVFLVQGVRRLSAAAPENAPRPPTGSLT